MGLVALMALVALMPLVALNAVMALKAPVLAAVKGSTCPVYTLHITHTHTII